MEDGRKLIIILVASVCYGSCEGHYCYYCGTLLDADTRAGIIQQRVFVYPQDALQKDCSMPQLLETGIAQLCDQPLCVTVTPVNEDAVQHSFTALGCAEMILRPSMLSRIPLDAYTSTRSEGTCVEFEHIGFGKRLKFNACFCNANWCNNGQGNDAGSTSGYSSPTSTVLSTFPIFTPGLTRLGHGSRAIEGSGEGNLEIMEQKENDNGIGGKQIRPSGENILEEPPPTRTTHAILAQRWPNVDSEEVVNEPRLSTAFDNKTSVTNENLVLDNAEETKKRVDKSAAMGLETDGEHSRDSVNAASSTDPVCLVLCAVYATHWMV